MPAGYTYKARTGFVRTDATANKYPLGFKQYKDRVSYVVAAGSNVAALPIAASGVQGSPGTPTWVSASLSSFIPPTPSSVFLSLQQPASGLQAIAAPNATYGAIGSTTNPPPFSAGNPSSIVTYANSQGEMVLEALSVQYASNSSGASITVLGWKDNL